MPEKFLIRNEVLQNGEPLPLATLLQTKNSGLTITDGQIKRIWAQAIADIHKLVLTHFKAVEPEIHQLWELDQQKIALVKKMHGHHIVTMDSYDTTGAHKLGVSRHFATGGTTQICIGERPGYPQLGEQFQAIKQKAGTQPIIVLEDDMFTGGTAKYVLQLMLEAGLKVAAFIPGMQASGIQSIGNVPILRIKQFSNGVRDIVDPRDFLFGLPEAGLVIRKPMAKNRYILYRAPWCLPFVDVAARASVEQSMAKKFSLGVIELNAMFFSKLQGLLGTISISDLAPAFQTFVHHECPLLPKNATIDDFCAYAEELLATTLDGHFTGA